MGQVGEFFRTRFPALVRRQVCSLLLSAALLATGTLAGFWITLRDPERFYGFVDAQMAGSRSPASSREELLRVLYDSGGASASEALTSFATFLFTHNAKIGLLCFALGFLAGVPVMFLLFVNG